MWDDAREDAEGAIRSGDRLEIYASDIDPDVLSLARKGAHDARVESHINFECSPVKNLTSDLQYGCIICNPPYGERLGDARSAEGVYRDMKTSFTRLGTWSYYVLTSYPRFEKVFGLYADKKRKVFNGQIECVFYQFYGPKPPRK
jgi:putative N6-adenine-specific DNA methylase